MTTITQSRSRVNRKVPEVVHGSCTWVVQPGLFNAAPGFLRISTARGSDVYQVETIEDGLCVLGYRLTKTDGSGIAYDVDTTVSPWKCDCPDNTYTCRPDGQCKHAKGLRAALARLGGTN